MLLVLNSTSRSSSEHLVRRTSLLTSSSMLRSSDGPQASAAHVRAGRSHTASWTPVQRVKRNCYKLDLFRSLSTYTLIRIRRT
eukprot:2065616-Heterocapsa_arctica.AAC.1